MVSFCRIDNFELISDADDFHHFLEPKHLERKNVLKRLLRVATQHKVWLEQMMILEKIPCLAEQQNVPEEEKDDGSDIWSNKLLSIDYSFPRD